MNKITSYIDRATGGSPGHGYTVFLHVPAELACERMLNQRKLGKALLPPPAHKRDHTAENGKGDSGNGW